MKWNVEKIKENTVKESQKEIKVNGEMHVFSKQNHLVFATEKKKLE